MKINFKRLYSVRFIKFILANLLACALILLAVSALALAQALNTFSWQLASIEKEMPQLLNRTEKVVINIQNTLHDSQSIGENLSKGMGKGAASSIVDLPYNTVTNVGGKVIDTINTAREKSPIKITPFINKLFFSGSVSRNIR